ncbi:MAG: LEA type 2 family protein [Desulfobacterales bacterium]|nr:LEA type 2 family protein [Desulfobacterales bacterium]
MPTGKGWRPQFALRALLFILLSGGLPWGCATLGEDIEPPHISLVKITPLQSDDLESAITLHLRLVNPNDRTFRIRGVTCKLDINGNTIAAGSSNTAVELPQLGTVVMPVTVYTSMTDFMWLMFRMMSSAPEKREALELTYALRGKLFLNDAPPGLDRLTFETQGDLIKLRSSPRPTS